MEFRHPAFYTTLMLRRKFLASSVAGLTASLLPLPMLLSSSSSLPTPPVPGAGILMGSEGLSSLYHLESFNKIDQTLQKYGSYPLHADSTDSKFLGTCIATLNSSYGRWLNFDLQKFLSHQDPALNEDLYIFTSGPDGRRLSENTSLKVIGRRPLVISDKFFVDDAYPHFFNLLGLQGKKESFRKAYAIDRSSRARIHLYVQLPESLSESDRQLIAALSAELQDELTSHEIRAIDLISKKFRIYEFEDLLNIVSNQKILG